MADSKSAEDAGNGETTPPEYSLVDARNDLVRQEHRSLRVILNLYRALRGEDSAPNSGAAWEAFLWWLVSPGKLAAAGVSVVGVVGIWMAYQANELLERQNFLLESDRRAAQTFELSAILDEIDEELDALESRTSNAEYGSTDGLLLELLDTSADPGHLVYFPDRLAGAEAVERAKDEGYFLQIDPNDRSALLVPLLSPRLEGRIIAIDKAFRPYRYLDAQGELIDTPVSPERAQLLISLVESNVFLGNIIIKGDFSFSDLEGASLVSGADTPHYQSPLIDLSTIDLSRSKLRRARFHNASLASALLVGTDLTEAELAACTLNDADLSGATLEGTKITDTDLRVRSLSGTELRNVILSACLMPEPDQVVDFVADGMALSAVSEIVLDRVIVTSEQWPAAFEQHVPSTSDFNAAECSIRALDPAEIVSLPWDVSAPLFECSFGTAPE